VGIARMGPRRMSASVKTIAAMITALALTVSTGMAGGIECSKIGTAYDDLFVDGNNRVQGILAKYKALPASAGDQQKDAVRKKFCAIAGELVGFYKFVQALANDCAKGGDQMGPLQEIINKQLGLAKQGVKDACGYAG
jgi:hypothetical protein